MDVITGVTLCGEFCGEFNWDEQDPSIKIVYGITLFFIQLVLPAIVMSFCYWKILQKASRVSHRSLIRFVISSNHDEA